MREIDWIQTEVEQATIKIEENFFFQLYSLARRDSRLVTMYFIGWSLHTTFKYIYWYTLYPMSASTSKRIETITNFFLPSHLTTSTVSRCEKIRSTHEVSKILHNINENGFIYPSLSLPPILLFVHFFATCSEAIILLCVLFFHLKTTSFSLSIYFLLFFFCILFSVLFDG